MPKAKADGGEQPAKAAPSRSLAEVQESIVADKSAALERVLETAPTAAPAKAEKAEAPEKVEAPAEPLELTPERYTEWFESQPLEMRAAFAANVKGARDTELAQMWGPEVVSVLQEVQADPKLAKIFKSLTVKEKRDWLADTALDIYDDPRYATTAATDDAPDPKYAALEGKFNDLQEKLTKSETDKVIEAYQTERRDEYQAFMAKYPALNYDPAKVRFTADGSDVVPASGVDKNDRDFKNAKRVLAIINRAEEQSRKNNRKISYADVGIEMMDMWDAQATNPAPRVVPNVSSKEIPSPQAPRTKVEARRGIAEQIQKHGNISNLQRALRS